MLVLSLMGVNFGFWARLGCSGLNTIIFSRKGLFQGCTRRNIEKLSIVNSFYLLDSCNQNLKSSPLGVKKRLDHAQIGLLQGFHSKFPTSIPSPFTFGVPPGPFVYKPEKGGLSGGASPQRQEPISSCGLPRPGRGQYREYPPGSRTILKKSLPVWRYCLKIQPVETTTKIRTYKRICGDNYSQIIAVQFKDSDHQQYIQSRKITYERFPIVKEGLNTLSLS